MRSEVGRSVQFTVLPRKLDPFWIWKLYKVFRRRLSYFSSQIPKVPRNFIYFLSEPTTIYTFAEFFLHKCHMLFPRFELFWVIARFIEDTWGPKI